MCLGIPGRIIEILDEENALAMVDISGVKRQVNLGCVMPDAAASTLIGRWTLVHVGFAMSLIDEDEAQKTLQILAELGELQEELAAMQASQTD
ncbi:HypC/HybG/HupF family hydrogenase formation chaperone [Marinobacterium jannaschii]|uniref:HypC/HybG/HupF family hydrogenase formation chaperone n=1 Tax=Marinobacterium jannaschii TaxID=64970 RepID=UPI000480CFCB|nr:HypC/HybG/HupF family hydrogenase formation chaperone [Marinobacterium jannaschii]